MYVCLTKLLISLLWLCLFADSHDLVLRFNHAPTKGYELDVGSKTSVRILNSQVVSKPEFHFLDSNMYHNIKLLAWDPCNYTSTLQQVSLFSSDDHYLEKIQNHWSVFFFLHVCSNETHQNLQQIHLNNTFQKWNGRTIKACNQLYGKIWRITLSMAAWSYEAHSHLNYFCLWWIMPTPQEAATASIPWYYVIRICPTAAIVILFIHPFSLWNRGFC